MLFFLVKFISMILSPMGLLLTGVALATACLWGRWWKMGRIGLTMVVCVAVLLPLSGVGGWAVARLEDRFPQPAALPDHIDGIIVLGGMVNQFISARRGQLTVNDAAERLFETVLLARQHPEAMVLFCGGSGVPLREKPTEAEVAVPFLVSLGIDPKRILIDDRSRDTYENALFGKRIAHPEKGGHWVLITSARHMPRSVGVFRHVGWTVIPYPVDYLTAHGENGNLLDTSTLGRLEILTQAAHEWLGLLYYRLAGRTEVIFPGP